MKKNCNIIYSIIALCMVIMVILFTIFQEKEPSEQLLQLEENKIIISFNNDDEIIQSFFGIIETISQIDIEFSPQLREISVDLMVYDNDAEVYYHNPVLKVREKTNISLDKPIISALGQEYYIKIKPLDNFISFFATKNMYPDNHLLVNGLEKEEDIILVQHGPDVSSTK